MASSATESCSSRHRVWWRSKGALVLLQTEALQGLIQGLGLRSQLFAGLGQALEQLGIQRHALGPVLLGQANQQQQRADRRQHRAGRRAQQGRQTAGQGE